ncbi:ATP-binding protein [Nostocales cyanobacterium LEGE 12452]|nr:ATP-binding protein [Nostocales cyanobacterium LEGE 12452]
MPFPNPKLGIDFSNYIAGCTKNFTGREWVFRAIREWLSDPDGSRYFLLTGDPGSGKTSIAAQLTRISQGEFTCSKLAPGFLSAFHFCSVGRSNWTDPRNFARSIALQLAANLTYAQVLKEIGDGDKHLNIKVDIDVKEAKNSAIQGVVIKNLSLGGLSGQEAFNRLIVDPLNILYQENIKDKIIILVDSLDEALAYSGGKSIVSILSELQDLSSNVRFICTTRSTRLVLSYFESLKPHRYTLITKSEANQKDLCEYIKTRTSSKTVKEKLLKEANLELDYLKSRLLELADGNFLVANHVINEIETDKLKLSDLSNALKGFDGIYQSFLRRFCGDDWDKNYQPILGIFSVAYEALTEEQLRNFLSKADDYHINPTKLRRSLGVLLQYLEAEQNFVSEAYKLHHAALREYLLDEKRNQDFWCDAKDFHNLVIRFYQSFTEILDASSFKQIDTYGLRHLTKHLIKIASWDELIRLLSRQTEDGKNAWFNAKDEVSEPAGFLDDVDLLIQNLPKELSSEEFKALTSIEALNYQVELIIKLASCYPNSLLPEALNIAIGSTDDHYKKRLLTALVDKFPPELLPKALEVALAIQDALPRAKALIALADKLPEALPMTLDAAQAIEDEFARAKALIALADKLTLELLPQALNAVQAMQNEYYRAEVLTALANTIPEVLPMALDAAQVIQNESRSAQSLIALADKLTPELLPQALNAAQVIRDEYYRVEALTALANKIPEALSMALDTAQAIENEFARAKALIALADKLTPELLPQALNAAQAIEDEFDLTTLLIELMNKFPQSFTPYFLSSIQTIKSEYFRTKALISLASYLPENLSEDIKQRISNIIQFIQDDSYKATLKAEFASYAPEIIEGVKLDDI